MAEQRARDAKALRLAPIAAKLQPALWTPCYVLRDATRTFTLSGVTLDEAHAVVAGAIELLMKEPPPPPVDELDERLESQRMEVRVAERGRVVVWLWTPRGWFDLVRFKLSAAPGGAAGVVVTARSSSTGMLPLGWTCALPINCICAPCCLVSDMGARLAKLEHLIVEHARAGAPPAAGAMQRR
ncbi:hypothetical protein KFE25_011261 [Diacronema lutheri]|uniref:Uncharacterized protein n=1 Tax=Diacronema lutheri TaxID=2081491 RepID=A0A8J5XMB8_DIALT|nr:hypothetical protein KFE25_011261 [Diacronema lutheri]|mmetsp:Transcript_2601/g.8162  ORF Transcript_2601/g.8162 Transcript_2601/m.8162 type:complete len:184 (-) Transcript_2601:742-1293(-)